MRSFTFVAVCSAFAIVLTSRPAAAQAAGPGEIVAGVPFSEQVDIVMGDGPMSGLGGGANIQFMAAPIAFDTQTVTDAPYSADAVTEVVQALADGNKIVRQSKVEISRDSAGRTRRVQGLSMLGPVINDQQNLRHVQITDPQTKTTIMLDLESKTAHRMPAPNVKFIENGAAAGVAVGMSTFTLPAPPPPMPGPETAGKTQFMYRAAGAMQMNKPTVEQLGTQNIEGVQADGIRTSYTIPAGAIGNQLPITVTSERWTSPELKVLVMSKQSDPRFGETVYRLTNINRSEPSPELFQIPSDFTVVEGGGPNRAFTFERRVQ